MTNEYIAGFFDGEGTIAIVGNRLRMSIPQTNFEVLDEIRQFLSFGSIFKEKKRKEHWKDSWVLYTSNSEDTYRFLLRVKNLLIVKKDKAEKAIKVYEDVINRKSLKMVMKVKALDLVKEGKSYREIEKETGVGRQTICRLMKTSVGL